MIRIRKAMTATGMAALGLFILGCDPDSPSVPLSVFSGGEVWVDSVQKTSAADEPERLVVHLIPGAEVRGCPRLSDRAVASLNGTRLRTKTFGGMQTGFTPGCDVPEFFLDLAASIPEPMMDGLIEVRDSSTTMTISVRGLIGKRRLAPGQTLATVLPGQRLTFDWLPSDDRLLQNPVIAIISAQAQYYHLDVAISGAKVTAIVPTNIPPGPSQLESSADIGLTVTQCVGVANCTSSLFWSLKVDTIVFGGP